MEAWCVGTTMMACCLSLFSNGVKGIGCRRSTSPDWFFPSTGFQPTATVRLPSV